MASLTIFKNTPMEKIVSSEDVEALYLNAVSLMDENKVYREEFNNIKEGSL